MLNDKYFTAEITEEDRKELFSTLGLDGVPFLFVESVGDVFIRVDECLKNQSNALLHLTSRPLLESYCSEKRGSVIELQSVEGKTVPQQPVTNSLWETIFPFPFCKAATLFEAREGKKVVVKPASFETSLFRLQEALSTLEKKMASFEVGLVSFHGPTGDFNLLFHFVRGLRIRAGVPYDFDSFLSTFRGANPTISDLEGYFGTSVAYSHVVLPTILADESSLENLAVAILDASSSIVCSSRRLQEEPQEPQIQL